MPVPYAPLETSARSPFQPFAGTGGVAAGKVPLGEAVLMTVMEVNQTLTGHPLEVSFSRWPDVRVGSEVRGVVRCWVRFLAQIAGCAEASLYVCASEARGVIELSLVLYLNSSGAAFDSADTGSLAEASRLLDEIGGDFNVKVEYPEVAVHLAIPPQ